MLLGRYMFSIDITESLTMVGTAMKRIFSILELLGYLVALFPNGQPVLFGSDDETLKLWDLGLGK